MKKAVLVVMAVLGLALVFACASTSEPKPQQSSSPQGTDEAFKDVYDRYRKDLILDGAEKYTVVKGDVLSAISRTKYNNGFYFPVIMLASSDIVLDPDKIEPGMVLTIPNLQRNLNDANARANIKKFLGEIAKLEDERKRADTAQGLRNLAGSL
jgi:hypothetical protein